MEETKKQLVNRLKRIEGHVGGIAKMVEGGQDESDILVQMVAVQSAVKKACAILVENKIKHSLAQSLDKNVEQQGSACSGCSKYPDLKKAIDEMDYDDLVDFILRYVR